MSRITGYKVFNPDWTCRGFKYQVGKIYTVDDDISLCFKGFHFCQKISNCFNYYSFDINNKVAIVETLDDGKCLTEGNKSVTNKIYIVKELSWSEVLFLANDGLNNTGYGNSGDRNTGNGNTGDYNTGDGNTGNYNTGDNNTGDRNTGYRNTGDGNIGDRNTGYGNTGHYNTGDYNTGYGNTGHWNKTDFSTGVFNTEIQTIKIFNKDTDLTLKDWYEHPARRILNSKFYNTKWIYYNDMTEIEKQNNPQSSTYDGYLKVIPYKEACNNMWDFLTAKEKEIVMNIPNFDKNIFFEITGIKI